MKKICIVFLLAVTVILSCSVVQGNDRYNYITTALNGSMWYIDKYSIAPSNNPNVFRFWCREVVSDTHRAELIASQKFSNQLYRLHDIMYWYEIDITQNLVNLAEFYMYDSHRDLLDQAVVTKRDWRSIPPNTVLEKICFAVKRIIQNNTYQSSPQPFVAPQPRTPQSQLPMNTPQQRESYRKLQEYNAWLQSQPDYPEFDRWFTRKLQEAGVTAAQVNAGLIEYVRQLGWDYEKAREIIAGWYREFYMEQYGGQ